MAGLSAKRVFAHMSWPSTSFAKRRKQDVDARHRRQVYAVCAQTAMAGHDEGIEKIPAASAAGISYRIASAMSYFKTIAVNG
jgi:hypothetical protein